MYIEGNTYFIESKYAIHGITQALHLPPAFKKEFDPQSPLVIVSAGGRKLKLSATCHTLPITDLHDYLRGIF